MILGSNHDVMDFRVGRMEKIEMDGWDVNRRAIIVDGQKLVLKSRLGTPAAQSSFSLLLLPAVPSFIFGSCELDNSLKP